MTPEQAAAGARRIATFGASDRAVTADRCGACGKGGCPSAADPVAGPFALHNAAAYAALLARRAANPTPPPEQPGPWRRDAASVDRCVCGHLATQHRRDMVRSSPCSTGDCDCTTLRPAARLWREHRWVVEPIA